MALTTNKPYNIDINILDSESISIFASPDAYLEYIKMYNKELVKYGGIVSTTTPIPEITTSEPIISDITSNPPTINPTTSSAEIITSVIPGICDCNCDENYKILENKLSEIDKKIEENNYNNTSKLSEVTDKLSVLTNVSNDKFTNVQEKLDNINITVTNINNELFETVDDIWEDF